MTKNASLCIGVMLVLFNASLFAQSQPLAAVQKEAPVKLRISIGDRKLSVTLNDSSAARDFLKLLPLTLTLEDYSRTEKISYLPRKLTMENEPAGIDPMVGNLAYYAPWGNIAIFYRDFGYSTGLILLGRLDSGIDAFSVSGSVKATFEIAE